MALFVCLCKLAGLYDFDVIALHVNHGIRGVESDRDEAFVRDLCGRENVPLVLHSANVPDLARRTHTGLELTARRVRQQFFEQLHEEGIVDAVATAHHLDDNAETLLLHVVRGAGLEGLVGIRPRREFLIRPFLCLRRQEIREYLRQLGRGWVEDSTNENVEYRRNFVRHELLPRLEQMNPRAAEALDRLSQTVRQDQDFLMLEAEKAVQSAATYGEKEAEIELSALKEAHRAISVRMLRIVLARLGKPLDTEYSHLEAVLQLALAARSGTSLDIGDGWRAEIRYGRLLLQRKADEAAPEYYEKELNLSGKTELPRGTVTAAAAAARRQGDGWSEFLDRDRIPAGAVLRTRRAGDTFHPLHGPGTKKLKDYFIDIKLPRQERDRVPLLADGTRILWVVGHRLAQDVAVDERTRRIVHLTYAERTQASEAALR